MSLLQSALDFLAGPGSLGGASGRDQSDFVGQTVELGDLRLRVRRVLAEGGFAFVYEAQDVGSGREYALKRLLSNEEEKNRAIIQEVCFMLCSPADCLSAGSGGHGRSTASLRTA
uniref:Protein kinase domain-containing protein n=1 Tax=Colobus angolensis palliatus TaxID=336983 RepID=A0A2K5JXL5_COLAP